MQIHEVKRKNKNKKSRLVGRGGKRGKTSGRGGKGQTARAGNKRRPQMRDIIKKLPKLRGYRFKSIEKVSAPVNLGSLSVFKKDETVNPKTLFEKGLVRKTSGLLPRVKILGGGEIDKPLLFEGCSISQAAKTKIEKSGGTIK